MPGVPLDRDHLKTHCDRLRRIESTDPAKWGSLTPVGMICHLRTSVEISLGQCESEDASNLFTRTVLKWVALHMPWPKGKVKAPDSLTPPPEEDLRGERERLLIRVEEFLTALESEPNRRAQHPAFGSIPLSQWALFHGLHFNHHLNQFGR